VNRDEWNHVLDTTQATLKQRGRIMSEFGRLGVDDRAQRLAVIAGLLGLDELASVNELTMGQAGQLINLLPGISDADDMPDGAAAAVLGQDTPSMAEPSLSLAPVYVLHSVAATMHAWNSSVINDNDQQR
jgi:hypothetical protein